jgi:hypothetical protein
MKKKVFSFVAVAANALAASWKVGRGMNEVHSLLSLIRQTMTAKGKLSIITVLALALLYTGCHAKKEMSESGFETEVIDFSSFREVEGDMPEDLVKEVKYIRLDGSSDMLFKGIDKIKIDNGRIFILDRRLKKLFVFDSEGTGIGTAGTLGQGPGEYLQITDFDVNAAGDIYFIDATADNDRLFVFNKDLQFVSVKKMTFDADLIHCLRNNKLLFGLASWNKGENSAMKIAVTDAGLNTEQTCLEYDEYMDNSFWISGYCFVETGNGVQYNKQIDNTVYEFSDDGLPLKAYRFDFGGENVPDAHRKEIEANFEEFKHYRCLKNFAVVNSKYILGTLWDHRKTRTFIVDRKNRTLYLSRPVATEDTSNLAGYRGNQIISYLYPGKYENIRETDFPPAVKEDVENDNTVICVYELK